VFDKIRTCYLKNENYKLQMFNTPRINSKAKECTDITLRYPQSIKMAIVIIKRNTNKLLYKDINHSGCTRTEPRYLIKV
jgi:hypothetical protein